MKHPLRAAVAGTGLAALALTALQSPAAAAPVTGDRGADLTVRVVNPAKT